MMSASPGLWPSHSGGIGDESSAMTDAPPLLSISGLSKTFPGQRALDDTDVSLAAGRIHALVGQNGSGKSTLIKILAGYHQPDPGYSATWFAGEESRELPLGDGHAADAAGLRFVHQDLGLVDSMSTVENLALGTGFTTRFGRIQWKADTERAVAALDELGFPDIPVSAPVGSLSASQRTAVALARALRGWEKAASLLVLDEPTASLPGNDVARLFDAIDRLRSRGVAIMYVSHHLDEVFALADDVSVLRDGKRVATKPVAALDHDRLIELMIGHRVERMRSTARRTSDRAVVEVTALSGGNVQDVSLAVYEGEVVGVAGITGSGREHLIPLVTGQIPASDGTVAVNGTDTPSYSPAAVLKAGSAFLAADRSTQGVLPTMPITANLTLCDVERNCVRRRLLHGRERSETRSWIERLGIKTPGTGAPIGALSGGNQQKVLLARGLRLSPQALLLDEPTCGVDVGAKEDVHRIIDDAAAGGSGVLVASTDSDELVRLASRVVVLRNGRIAAELVGAQITVENIERAQLHTRTTTDASPADAVVPDPAQSKEFA
jgi:ribose transport system ATP-binding protein